MKRVLLSIMFVNLFFTGCAVQNPELIQAVKDGNVRAVRNLLSDNPTINARDENGWTALNWAATKGHRQVVTLLIEKGADVDAKDSAGGRTPLWQASYEGHTAIVKLLLENGADINKRITSGETALWTASSNGRTDIVKLLLESGADVNVRRTDSGETALWRASWKGHTDIVKLLLENGADVDMAQTDSGITPLWIASQEGYIQIVKLLLEKNAAVNAKRTTDRATSLYQASWKGHADVAKLLLENGAEVNVKRPKDNVTALWTASQEGHTDIVKLLLENGADVNAKRTTDGVTALSEALEKGHMEVVRLLLDHSADVSVEQSLDIKTALWKDAQKSHTSRAYEDFLERYPDSEFAAEARAKIEKLVAEEKARIQRLEEEKSLRRTLAERKVKAASRLAEAKTPFQLEELLTSQPDMAEFILPKLEREIADDITENGASSRLVVSGIETETASPSSVTISDDGRVWALKMEQPSDRIFQNNMRSAIFGSGSIHRFSGEVKFDNIKLPSFVGTGDERNRLTFLLLKDTGYVYMRGKGRVVFPQGQTVELGSEGALATTKKSRETPEMTSNEKINEKDSGQSIIQTSEEGDVQAVKSGTVDHGEVIQANGRESSSENLKFESKLFGFTFNTPSEIRVYTAYNPGPKAASINANAPIWLVNSDIPSEMMFVNVRMGRSPTNTELQKIVEGGVVTRSPQYEEISIKEITIGKKQDKAAIGHLYHLKHLPEKIQQVWFTHNGNTFTFTCWTSRERFDEANETFFDMVFKSMEFGQAAIEGVSVINGRVSRGQEVNSGITEIDGRVSHGQVVDSGITEMALGTIRPNDIMSTYHISSDGRKFSYLAGLDETGAMPLERIEWRGNNRTLIVNMTPGYIVRGDKVQPTDYRILGGSFSPDGSRVAIQAIGSGEPFVVVDGVKQAVFDGIGKKPPVFSLNNKRLAYAAGKNGKAFYVIDGIPGESFDKVDSLAFSPDSKHIAFVASKEGKWFVVKDGEILGKTYDSLGPLVFSSDSKRLAYTAKQDGKWHLILDGVEGDAYDGIIEPGAIFSPDSKRVAYAVDHAGKFSAVIDGKISRPYDGILAPVFSPNSKRVAYMAWHSGGVSAVVDGETWAVYDGFVGGLAFSPNSEHVAYGVWNDGQYFVMKDKTKGPAFDNIQQPGPVFSPDSLRIAYSAEYGGKNYIIVDGKSYGNSFDGTLSSTNIVFDNPSTLHAVVLRGSDVYRIQVELTK